MAKLLHLLAASVGGGIVLGASIRLGEAIGSSARRGDPRRLAVVPPREPATRVERPDVSDRLERLENKVLQLQTLQTAAPSAEHAPEWRAVLADVVERIDRQQTEMEDMRHQVSKAAQTLVSAGNLGDGL